MVAALAQCVPVGIALSIYVVLRSQSQLGDNAIAFFQVGNRQLMPMAMEVLTQ